MPLTSLRFTWAAPPSQSRDSEFTCGMESCLNFMVNTFFLLFGYFIVFHNNFTVSKYHVYFFGGFQYPFQRTTLCQPLPVAVCRSLAPTMVRRRTFSSGTAEIKFRFL